MRTPPPIEFAFARRAAVALALAACAVTAAGCYEPPRSSDNPLTEEEAREYMEEQYGPPRGGDGGGDNGAR